MCKPFAIDLFCGLGGWSDGLIATGYDVIGFDIEQHAYGEQRYPGQLVIQDVLTLHGSQFRDAAVIVASPPCQEYSYMAMPWSLAKAKAAAIRADTTGAMRTDLTRLFDACFRLQREACAAAGRHIPLIVENVRGAQPWVGRARWNFGSFYLWGDVPALMPVTMRAQKFNPDGTAHPPGSWFAVADSKNRGARSGSVKQTGVKAPGMNWSDRTLRGQDFTRIAGAHATKNSGGSWFAIGGPGQKVTGQNPDGRLLHTGVKNGGDWFGSGEACSEQRRHGSKSNSRKAASAMIAKIPLPLSLHIARTFKP